MYRIFLTCAAVAMASVGTAAHAAEYVTLRNGFNLVCDHRVADGGKVRLYLDAKGNNYLEVAASDIVSDEQVNLPKAKTAEPAPKPAAAASTDQLPTADLGPLLTKAGQTYDLDTALLASVIREESGGNARAVSRAGAEGLMQLMPETASDLGVGDRFAASENIRGGTAYLDSLLNRYSDNLPLALAAYNAGPAAVDRWHGIPPYPETRAYVARVIHEYNRRYKLRRKAELQSAGAQASAR